MDERRGTRDEGKETRDKKRVISDKRQGTRDEVKETRMWIYSIDEGRETRDENQRGEGRETTVES
jgi:hypothetical protein